MTTLLVVSYTRRRCRHARRKQYLTSVITAPLRLILLRREHILQVLGPAPRSPRLVHFICTTWHATVQILIPTVVWRRRYPGIFCRQHRVRPRYGRGRSLRQLIAKRWRCEVVETRMLLREEATVAVR